MRMAGLADKCSNSAVKVVPVFIMELTAELIPIMIKGMQ